MDCVARRHRSATGSRAPGSNTNGNSHDNSNDNGNVNGNYNYFMRI
jgi:hypothetical protein